MKRGSPYKRTIRRHHRERLLIQWVKRVRMELRGTDLEGNSIYIEQRARYLLQTPKSCSCPMCGNPRRYFGERTIQERRIGIE